VATTLTGADARADGFATGVLHVTATVPTRCATGLGLSPAGAAAAAPPPTTTTIRCDGAPASSVQVVQPVQSTVQPAPAPLAQATAPGPGAMIVVTY
jgi:hypothetical protein